MDHQFLSLEFFCLPNMELLFTMKMVMLLKHLHILFSVFLLMHKIWQESTNIDIVHQNKPQQNPHLFLNSRQADVLILFCAFYRTEHFETINVSFTLDYIFLYINRFNFRLNNLWRQVSRQFCRTFIKTQSKRCQVDYKKGLQSWKFSLRHNVTPIIFRTFFLSTAQPQHSIKWPLILAYTTAGEVTAQRSATKAANHRPQSKAWEAFTPRICSHKWPHQ